MTSVADPTRTNRFSSLTRRDLLKGGGGLGVAAALGLPERALAASGSQLVATAAQTAPAGSDLGAIEHVVFLMMENRSYDHYFGAYPRGRGFSDHPTQSLGPFAQPYPAGGGLKPANVLLPYHLDKTTTECSNDLVHNWGPMHQCVNRGRMDSFVKTHTSSQWEGPKGTTTMGYFTREDLPFYYALADNFTLCDAYHCSVIGPTHPNRMMANTGTIDPAGLHGGPITDTSASPDVLWSTRWTTVQEVLEDAGVSWKVYHPAATGLPLKYQPLALYPGWNEELYDPKVNPLVMLLSDHVLPYVAAFENPESALHQKAFDQKFPGDFLVDIRSGNLPKVSWIIPPAGFDEHPSASPDKGTFFSSMVLEALVSSPAVWAKTVLFLMYDENDGWFDHVPPSLPPPNTKDEHLTAAEISSETLGFRDPIGLGVRVPMLVMSPFSRGGHIVSDVFDHTSQLQFLHERFGVDVPNVSAWRRKTVGDLTSTLFNSPPSFRPPALPSVPIAPLQLLGSCVDEETFINAGGYHQPPPRVQHMPSQSSA